MPIHDWTRVDAGLFHDFHQGWIINLRNALNRGVLPADYFALAEQTIRGPVPDVLTLRLAQEPDELPRGTAPGLAVAAASPGTRVVRRSESEVYARKADRITVRHRHGEVVAVVEIVSPGNKVSNNEVRSFVENTSTLIAQGVHLLVIDVLPPNNTRVPHGIHKSIWDEFEEEDFELATDQPLILAAYDAGPPRVAYVEAVGVGDVLPVMPLFLKPEFYVRAPLGATYQVTWADFSAPLKHLLEPALVNQPRPDRD
jgi:hypothetical protein